MSNGVRGSAAIECAAVLTTLVLITSGALTVAYALFARAWLEYAGEQALLCLAEDRGRSPCTQELFRRVRQLPFGELRSSRLAAGSRWRVELSWRVNAWTFHLDKALDARRISRRGALRL